MTAIAAFARPEGAHLWTDLANCGQHGGQLRHPDGGPPALAQKVIPLAHMSAALAVRGDLMVMQAAHSLGLLAFTGPDDLVARFGAELKAEVKAAVGDLPDEYLPGLEIVAAIWSKRTNAPQVHTLSSRGWPAKPWHFHRAAFDFLVTPMDAVTMHRLAQRGLFARPLVRAVADKLDAFKDGLTVMRELREIWAPLGPDGAKVQPIGGGAQLTIVTADGVATRVVERWPARDEAGLFAMASAADLPNH